MKLSKETQLFLLVAGDVGVPRAPSVFGGETKDELIFGKTLVVSVLAVLRASVPHFCIANTRCVAFGYAQYANAAHANTSSREIMKKMKKM